MATTVWRCVLIHALVCKFIIFFLLLAFGVDRQYEVDIHEPSEDELLHAQLGVVLPHDGSFVVRFPTALGCVFWLFRMQSINCMRKGFCAMIMTPHYVLQPPTIGEANADGEATVSEAAKEQATLAGNVKQFKTFLFIKHCSIGKTTIFRTGSQTEQTVNRTIDFASFTTARATGIKRIALPLRWHQMRCATGKRFSAPTPRWSCCTWKKIVTNYSTETLSRWTNSCVCCRNTNVCWKGWFVYWWCALWLGRLAANHGRTPIAVFEQIIKRLVRGMDDPPWCLD